MAIFGQQAGNLLEHVIKFQLPLNKPHPRRKSWFKALERLQ